MTFYAFLLSASDFKSYSSSKKKKKKLGFHTDVCEAV